MILGIKLTQQFEVIKIEVLGIFKGSFEYSFYVEWAMNIILVNYLRYMTSTS